MALQKLIYNTFFKRSSVFITGIVAGAFAYEIAFDTGADMIWDSINKGRQWKDIRSKYVN
ncbi:cytochrome b-c1 complex subunit 9 [Zopfochytrium polystomum]|nr:cytochrome b-c1 complex subunit 9 [Zopfochytrium polystomum]